MPTDYEPSAASAHDRMHSDSGMAGHAAENTEPKILVEFTLLPKGKAALQYFFDTRFNQLRGADREEKAVAKAELVQILQKTLPLEFQQMLGGVFTGASEYAVLIHNLPEREEFTNGKPIPIELHKPVNAYSFHIGNALYEMGNVKSVGVDRLKRSRNRGEHHVIGQEIHRDVPLQSSLKDNNNHYVEYVIFSSPHNAEHAATEAINLKKAVESIPSAIREKIAVRVQTMEQGKAGESMIDCSLNEVLDMLGKPLASPGSCRKIFLLSEPGSPEANAFNTAAKHYGKEIDLQPGDLLILNQHKIFHRAHQGHPEMISHPYMLSRLLLANSGMKL